MANKHIFCFGGISVSISDYSYIASHIRRRSLADVAYMARSLMLWSMKFMHFVAWRKRLPMPSTLRKHLICGAVTCFLQRPQIILLRDGTDTSQGKGQLISNINACCAVADVIRSTLGPCGMDKLIHDKGTVRLKTNNEQ